MGRLRQYWGSYMPHVFCLTYCRTLLSMAVTPGTIACGVEKTGQVRLDRSHDPDHSSATKGGSL